MKCWAFKDGRKVGACFPGVPGHRVKEAAALLGLKAVQVEMKKPRRKDARSR